MKRVFIRWCCGFLLALVSITAFAESFRVSDIRVEGLQRVSAGTVFSALPIRVGDIVTQADIQEATRELFKQGFFTDVAINRDGDVLVMVFKERPAISKIEFQGNKAIKTENLMDSLKKNNLSEGQIFQRVTLENITQALQREYVAQGRYGATVNIETEDLPRNQVKVVIKVKEGEVSRIKQINIIGNTKFSDSELLDMFELRSSTFWSWLSGDDKYSKEKMKGDLERIESYYMDRGYLSFKVDSSQISVSPDKTKIFVTVNITEGDIYTISAVELAGDPVIPESALKVYMITQPKQIFSQILMTTSAESMTNRLGNEGYTFAKVEGHPEKNEEDKTVKITYYVEPGKRVYVNRINFKGNTKSMDEVLRREMRQMEGGSASSAQIENGKIHLERLTFFKEVKVENKEVPGSSDKVDVNYTVEEQPSGSMTLSIGYGQYYGLMFNAGIQQTNWFGTGKAVGFNFSKSKFQSMYSLNYSDPYFTPDGVSRGLSVYYQDSNYGEYNVTPYSTNTIGGKVSFGYPVTEIERIGFDVGIRSLEIVPTGYSSQEIRRTPRVDLSVSCYDSSTKSYLCPDGYITESDVAEFIKRKNQGIDSVDGTFIVNKFTDDVLGPKGFIDKYGTRFNDATVDLYWAKSTLNRGILPDRGAAQRFSVETTLPGGDLEYFKIDYETQYFKPLSKAFTLKLRGHVGYADKYGKTDRLPFFENFYGGGFGSVRGFERNSLGPRTTTSESQYTVPIAWDDLNGDGILQSGESSHEVMVLCGTPEKYKNNECSKGKGTILNAPRQNYYDRTFGSFGGNAIIEGGVELLFDLPFIKDHKSVQTELFIDAGNVFDTHCRQYQLNCYNFQADQIKMSAGLGLTWISSFGPMTFSLAKPISKTDKYDRREVFQFSMGQAF